MPTADELATFLIQNVLELSVSASRKKNFEHQLREVLQKRFLTPTLPLKGQTVGVSIDRRKTAALFFDRVWAEPISDNQPPRDVVVYGATDIEIWGQILIWGVKEGWWTQKRARLFFREAGLAPIPDSVPVVRAIAESMSRKYMLSATPVFDSEDARNEQYQAGRYEVILAAIENVPIVIEDALTWRQVKQFRADAEARRKYRRLVHWFDRELVSKPVPYIADEIAERLHAYENVLNKHGVKTGIGVLSDLLAPGFIASASAAAGIAGATAGGVSATLTGLSLAIGRVALTVASRNIDLDDNLATHGEVAFVHELRKRFLS
jgi:hypothetical protein